MEPVHSTRSSAYTEELGSTFCIWRWEASTDSWGPSVWVSLLKQPSNQGESWLDSFVVAMGWCWCHSETPRLLTPEAHVMVLAGGALGQVMVLGWSTNELNQVLYNRGQRTLPCPIHPLRLQWANSHIEIYSVTDINLLAVVIAFPPSSILIDKVLLWANDPVHSRLLQLQESIRIAV